MRRLEDRLAARDGRDRVVVRDRFAAALADLRDDLVGDPRRARSIRRRAQIVDDHLRALAREIERDLAPDAAARARDDRDLPLENAHLR